MKRQVIFSASLLQTLAVGHSRAGILIFAQSDETQCSKRGKAAKTIKPQRAQRRRKVHKDKSTLHLLLRFISDIICY